VRVDRAADSTIIIIRRLKVGWRVCIAKSVEGKFKGRREATQRHHSIAKLRHAAAVKTQNRGGRLVCLGCGWLGGIFLDLLNS
jgi:hypothetical protein